MTVTLWDIVCNGIYNPKMANQWHTPEIRGAEQWRKTVNASESTAVGELTNYNTTSDFEIIFWYTPKNGTVLLF